MQPNTNFLKFFPDVELSDNRNKTMRSSCLHTGSFIIIKKITDWPEHRFPLTAGMPSGTTEKNPYLSKWLSGKNMRSLHI